MSNNASNSQGFTLVEILVSMSILVLIFVIASDFIGRSFTMFRFNSEQETAVNNSRRIMGQVTMEIRKANSSARGDYAINSIGDHGMIFYSDVDDDGQTERVRYFLSGSMFQRGITEPGTSNDYSGAENISDLAGYINNQAEPIFTFYDSNNATTSAISDVRMVNVRLKINVTPLISPADYYLESNVQLRNLKDNL